MTDLLVGLAFTIGTFFALLLLYFVYFFQDRRNGLTSTLYKYIIIDSIVVIVTELISSFLLYDKLSPTLGVILLKFHWFTGLFYFYLFYFYVSAHFNNIQDVSVKDYIFKTKEGKIIGVITILISIAFFIAPFGELDYHALSYMPGLPAYIMFGYGVIIISITFIKFLMKKDKSKNHTTIMILFLVSSSILLVIQLKWRNIAFSPSLMAFLLLGCYFILENPDLYTANELEKSKKELEELSTFKKTIITQKSNNIKDGIFNISQSTYNAISDTNLDSSKEIINSNITTLNNMINDMQNVLNMLIINDDSTKTDECEYDTLTLLTQVYKYANKNIGNKNVTLEFDIDQFLPTTLYGDSNIVYQAMINSINSSIKNTVAGKIVFKLKCIFNNEQVLLNITINDTSNGLKEEDVDKINNESVNITDLNNLNELNIAKKLITFLNGTFRITSSIGNGTNIIISFNQKIVNQFKIGEFKPIEINHNLNVTNRKVLILDNNPNTLAYNLSKYNIAYDVVSTFEECINKLKLDESITTIFIDPSTDLSNPNMANTLKTIMVERPDLKNKIIAVSANLIAGTRKKYLDQGYDYFIYKPINEFDFYNIIKNI